MSAPTGDELSALARKYRALAELRRAHDRDGSVADRATLRALAREFPGSLRELDTLELDEIDDRAAALERAAAGAGVEPWMEWLVAYHALLRAALFVKPRVAVRSAPTDDERWALAEEASRRAGVPIGIDFVRAVERPPEGRIGAVVLERLASRFGEPAAAMTTFVAGRRGRGG